LAVTLSADSGTLEFFNDGRCIGKPPSWSVSAGTGELSVYFSDSTPGAPTITVSADGLDAGLQQQTFACAATERLCQSGCIPTGDCCDDNDCTDGGVPWVCGTAGQCEPPDCSGFPAGCTTYDDRTSSTASRTITFNSSGYAPKCMRIGTSQSVTFSGSFFIHPLVQFCGPRNANMSTSSGSSRTISMPSGFGTYGYRCKDHPVFEQGAIRIP
jgi:hypothetical protein